MHEKRTSWLVAFLLTQLEGIDGLTELHGQPDSVSGRLEGPEPCQGMHPFWYSIGLSLVALHVV